MTSASLDAALSAAERRFIDANPRSRARHERARAVLPGGHSRQTLYYAPFPLTVAHGEGARITDVDGHEYLNLVGDFAAGVFGHRSEPIHQAVQQAMRSGISLSGPNTHEVELAELISQRIPSIQQVRFCNSGSEACLFAAQLARHATKRPKLLVFNGAYHGGFMVFREGDAPLTVPIPVIKATYNDVPGTRALIRAHAAELAAVMVEPMMGSSGCIPGAPEFLAMLREETTVAGSPLIFDEVMTSRLGPGGVQGLRNMQPDLTTLGKFWGGGFAFGAFGGSRDLMRHLDLGAGGSLSQGGTYNNHVLTMTAGLIGARDVYTSDACNRLNALGDFLREELNAVGRSLDIAFQATGIGGVLNTHWCVGAISQPSQVQAAASPKRRLYHLCMLERGFYIAQRGMVNLSLPTTEADVAGFTRATREFLIEHIDALRLP
ncbi:MAG TPA: aminotransferase class III-fold pyridoxal phosphate-dependent enzyme [Steroidobacteraceae bacterium]|jgi:glutamate-1-semialdehyde 2,1-aminomutase|nr:aminotransferase class III-fold pyridoxal phosphate-dependent enzyme [Steroidobacteraceae bacterium]